MENLYFLFTGLLIYHLYVWVYVYFSVGILKSVSDSVYKIKHQPLFTFTMFLFPMFLVISGENVAINWFGEFTCFFACAGIIFVGAAPCFVKGQEMEEKVHVIGATGGILFGILYTVSFGWIYTIPALLFVLFTLYCHFVSAAHSLYRVKQVINEPATTPYLNWVERILIKLPIVKNHTWWIENIAVWYISIVVIIRSLFYL